MGPARTCAGARAHVRSRYLKGVAPLIVVEIRPAAEVTASNKARAEDRRPNATPGFVPTLRVRSMQRLVGQTSHAISEREASEDPLSGCVGWTRRVRPARSQAEPGKDG